MAGMAPSVKLIIFYFSCNKRSLEIIKFVHFRIFSNIDLLAKFNDRKISVIYGGLDGEVK